MHMACQLYSIVITIIVYCRLLNIVVKSRKWPKVFLLVYLFGHGERIIHSYKMVADS